MIKFNTALKLTELSSSFYISTIIDVVVVLLFYVHGKHLRSCRDCQLT